MSRRFNYHHLYYFWVVAKEGGVARAAARLGVAVQTVSAQVRALEQALGHALLKPAGRGVSLTEAGHAALRQADPIFQLGEALPDAVREASAAPGVRLAVGISDGLPKPAVHRLLEPALSVPNLRLLCHEGEFDELLAELALHRLDVVLADRAAPPNPNLKVYSHRLGASPVAWHAPPALAAPARRGFPQSLAEVPVLLPSAHAALRPRLDAWFEREGVRPRIAGEFEDSALLATFGAAGMGVFPAAAAAEVQPGLRAVGPAEGVEEQFWAVGTERRVQHPLVQRLLPAR